MYCNKIHFPAFERALWSIDNRLEDIELDGFGMGPSMEREYYQMELDEGVVCVDQLGSD